MVLAELILKLKAGWGEDRKRDGRKERKRKEERTEREVTECPALSQHPKQCMTLREGRKHIHSDEER